MCRCGISSTGINATQVIPSWRTGSGDICCANGTKFDGTNDNLVRNTQLVGVNDSTKLVMAFDYGPDGGVGTSKAILSVSESSLSPSIQIGFDASGRIEVSLSNGALATGFFTFRTALAYGTLVPVPYRAFNVLISASTGFSAGNKIGQIYVNDVLDTVIVSDATAAFDIEFTQGRFTYAIARDVKASTRLPMINSHLWFEPGNFLDFSDETNRRYFYTASNTPVCELFTSNNGSWAGGAGQPAVYLRDRFTSFQNNYGYGGALTVTGALTGGVSPCDTPAGLVES